MGGLGTTGIAKEVRMSGKRVLFLALAFLLALLLLDCSGKGVSPSPSGGLIFPPEVLSASPEVQEAYRFAAEHPEVLQYVPCYCRCEEVGHRNDWDCFIDSISPEGRVQIDRMGLG